MSRRRLVDELEQLAQRRRPPRRSWSSLADDVSVTRAVERGRRGVGRLAGAAEQVEFEEPAHGGQFATVPPLPRQPTAEGSIQTTFPHEEHCTKASTHFLERFLPLLLSHECRTVDRIPCFLPLNLDSEASGFMNDIVASAPLDNVVAVSASSCWCHQFEVGHKNDSDSIKGVLRDLSGIHSTKNAWTDSISRIYGRSKRVQ